MSIDMGLATNLFWFVYGAGTVAFVSRVWTEQDEQDREREQEYERQQEELRLQEEEDAAFSRVFRHYLSDDPVEEESVEEVHGEEEGTTHENEPAPGLTITVPVTMMVIQPTAGDCTGDWTTATAKDLLITSLNEKIEEMRKQVEENRRLVDENRARAEESRLQAAENHQVARNAIVMSARYARAYRERRSNDSILREQLRQADSEVDKLQRYLATAETARDDALSKNKSLASRLEEQEALAAAANRGRAVFLDENDRMRKNEKAADREAEQSKKQAEKELTAMRKARDEAKEELEKIKNSDRPTINSELEKQADEMEKKFCAEIERTRRLADARYDTLQQTHQQMQECGNAQLQELRDQIGRQQEEMRNMKEAFDRELAIMKQESEKKAAEASKQLHQLQTTVTQTGSERDDARRAQEELKKKVQDALDRQAEQIKADNEKKAREASRLHDQLQAAAIQAEQEREVARQLQQEAEAKLESAEMYDEGWVERCRRAEEMVNSQVAELKSLRAGLRSMRKELEIARGESQPSESTVAQQGQLATATAGNLAAPQSNEQTPGSPPASEQVQATTAHIDNTAQPELPNNFAGEIVEQATTSSEAPTTSSQQFDFNSAMPNSWQTPESSADPVTTTMDETEFNNTLLGIDNMTEADFQFMLGLDVGGNDNSQPDTQQTTNDFDQTHHTSDQSGDIEMGDSDSAQNEYAQDSATYTQDGSGRVQQEMSDAARQQGQDLFQSQDMYTQPSAGQGQIDMQEAQDGFQFGSTQPDRNGKHSSASNGDIDTGMPQAGNTAVLSTEPARNVFQPQQTTFAFGTQDTTFAFGTQQTPNDSATAAPALFSWTAPYLTGSAPPAQPSTNLFASTSNVQPQQSDKSFGSSAPVQPSFGNGSSMQNQQLTTTPEQSMAIDPALSSNAHLLQSDFSSFAAFSRSAQNARSAATEASSAAQANTLQTEVVDDMLPNQPSTDYSRPTEHRQPYFESVQDEDGPALEDEDDAMSAPGSPTIPSSPTPSDTAHSQHGDDVDLPDGFSPSSPPLSRLENTPTRTSTVATASPSYTNSAANLALYGSSHVPSVTSAFTPHRGSYQGNYPPPPQATQPPATPNPQTTVQPERTVSDIWAGNDEWRKTEPGSTSGVNHTQAPQAGQVSTPTASPQLPPVRSRPANAPAIPAPTPFGPARAQAQAATSSVITAPAQSSAAPAPARSISEIMASIAASPEAQRFWNSQPGPTHTSGSPFNPPASSTRLGPALNQAPPVSTNPVQPPRVQDFWEAQRRIPVAPTGPTRPAYYSPTAPRYGPVSSSYKQPRGPRPPALSASSSDADEPAEEREPGPPLDVPSPPARTIASMRKKRNRNLNNNAETTTPATSDPFRTVAFTATAGSTPAATGTINNNVASSTSASTAHTAPGSPELEDDDRVDEILDFEANEGRQTTPSIRDSPAPRPQNTNPGPTTYDTAMQDGSDDHATEMLRATDHGEHAAFEYHGMGDMPDAGLGSGEGNTDFLPNDDVPEGYQSQMEDDYAYTDEDDGVFRTSPPPSPHQHEDDDEDPDSVVGRPTRTQSAARTAASDDDEDITGWIDVTE